MISDYFKEVELRIINAELVADKKVNYSEFSPDEGMFGEGCSLLMDQPWSLWSISKEIDG